MHSTTAPRPTYTHVASSLVRALLATASPFPTHALLPLSLRACNVSDNAGHRTVEESSSTQASYFRCRMMRTCSGCVVDVLQDKHVVWLLYFRTDTSIPLATAMLRTLSTRVSFRACWRVKIHMPVRNRSEIPASSRMELACNFATLAGTAARNGTAHPPEG